MIRPIFSTTPYSLKFATKKANQVKQPNEHSQISFSGIMDNPSSKRVTDANGNTYVVESGGQLIIKNETKEKDGMKSALTGAGMGGATGAAAAKGKSAKNTASEKTDDLKNHEVQNTETSQAENDTETEVETKDETEQTTELDDDSTDVSETEYDDDDDDTVVFDDNLPIYEF